MTRRSIILVACGVLTVLVGIAVALISSESSTPASSNVAAVDPGADADSDGAAPSADEPDATRPEVPEGTEAVAIEAPFVAGGAGFVAVGDQVNVFALVDQPAPTSVAVLSDVTVLEVSAGAGTSSSSASNGSTPRQVAFVLAVPVDEVEAIVRAAGFNRLYVSIPSEGSPPRPTTVVGAVDLGDGAVGEEAP